jgi:acylphosphatase
MKKVKAIVSGKVQGVGFRMSTRAKAEKLGVYGTVRNLSNGDVEIVAAGETKQVDALLDWAKSGPPSAVVNDLQTEVMKYEAGEFDTFEIC